MSRGQVGTRELPLRSLGTWLIRELRKRLLRFPPCLWVGPRLKDTPSTIPTMSLQSPRVVRLGQVYFNAPIGSLTPPCRVSIVFDIGPSRAHGVERFRV